MSRRKSPYSKDIKFVIIGVGISGLTAACHHNEPGYKNITIFEANDQPAKLIAKTYTYFPHFSEKDLNELNPHKRLEEMQGNNNTYYIGNFF